MLRPHVVLDLLSSYTAYATGKGRRRAKILIVTSKLLTGFDPPS